MDDDTKIAARDFMHQAVSFEVKCSNDELEDSRRLLLDLEERLEELKRLLDV